MSKLAPHGQTILGVIVGLFVGLLFGIAIAVNEHPAPGYTVHHLSVHGMTHIAKGHVSNVRLSPTTDCTAYTPIVDATDNVDIDVTGNGCLYRAGVDYRGKASLLIVLVDQGSHARAVATWQGVIR